MKSAEPLRASRTAQMVAAYRARAMESWPQLCQDPWARALAGDEGFEVSRRFDAAFPHMTLWIAVRTASIDRRVSALLDQGVAQVVVLGAGLDSRATRLARPGVRFFEVDQPASSRMKQERVAALGNYPVQAASYVTCDFDAGEDFLASLLGAGFEPQEPAIFVWEGVTYYLSEQAVVGTLERLGQGICADSVVIFDHFGKRMIQTERLDGQALDTTRALANEGEPVKFGVNNPVPMLAEAGFAQVRQDSFEALCLALTGTYERERMFRFQWLVQASPARELLF